MENHSDQESKCSCSLEETHGSFKVVWEKFWNNATVHGFPYVFSSAGALKKGIWTGFSLVCFGLLVFQIVSLTLLYLQYPVTLRKSWHHTTEVDFPAVTVCNTNPIKRSLVHLSPRINALLARWNGGRDGARRRRDVDVHSRQKRDVVCINDCTGQADGDYQACSTCSSYFQCWAGNTFTQACAASTVWDDSLGYCDWTSSTCPITTTSEATTDTSGYCAIAAMDCSGNDITLATASVTDCKALCDSYSNCVAFNYLMTGVCYVKSACTALTSDSWIENIYIRESASGAHLCPTSSTPDADCTSGSNPVTDTCYWVESGPYTYYQARAACQAKGGDIAHMKREATKNFLINAGLIGGVDRWISLNDISSTYTYVWGDNDATSWTDWEWGQPSHWDQNCVAVRASGIQWFDIYCNSNWYKYAALCEKASIPAPADPTTVQPTTVQPTTVQLTTMQPTTVQPTTVQPTSVQPTTVQPTTMQPTTVQPTTVQPSTVQPTTVRPTTVQPTTVQPTTVQLTTMQPTTVQPTTVQPTSVQPTTVQPTTMQPTTVQPTTVQPSTVQPTTVRPTTVQPTTVQPTTVQPTTEAQTTTSLPTTIELTTTAEMTTEAEETTLADMTTEEVIEPTSQFEEREPYREDFVQETVFLEALADESEEIKRQMGYTLSELIVDCSFGGRDCKSSDFGTFFNAVHGNCYTFNANWNENSTGLYSASKSGISAGLELMLNINQDEYLENNNQGAGAVVVIHPANRMPFPEDEGLLAKSHRMTSFELTQVEVNKLGSPYGNCVDVKTKGKKDNVYQENLPIDYSTSACEKTCYQRHVISECGCADPQIPMSGSAFSDFDGAACDIRNVTQDDCMYGVELQYIANDFDCDCADVCSQVHYPTIASQTAWPSQIETASIADYLEFGHHINMTNREGYVSRNVLKLQIFFRELNFELNTELPKYTIPKLMNSFAGSLGLFLGCTVFSMIELLELVFDYILVCCYKPFKKDKEPPKTSTTSSSDSQQPRRPSQNIILSSANHQKPAETEQYHSLHLNAASLVSWDDMEVENIEETNSSKRDALTQGVFNIKYDRFKNPSQDSLFSRNSTPGTNSSLNSDSYGNWSVLSTSHILVQNNTNHSFV